MKLFRRHLVLVLLLMSTSVVIAQKVDNELIGKVFCGYQGWFNCKGDGSPRDAWVHWGGNPPAPGDLTFEVYPDVTDYQSSSLFQTGFEGLGNGQPSELFSSYKKDVIDVHCEWTEKYGIDGLALQRFLGPVLSSATIKANRDSVAVRLKQSAEKHGTLYYLMYDMAPGDVDGFKGDVRHMEDDLNFMESPNYAHSGGKPVICLWGIGFGHRDGDGYAENSQVIIDWLHDKGYYVIAGVNDDWRTNPLPGYASVYESLDMISPWTPGRYRHVDGARRWKSVLSGDKRRCDDMGIDYQPVIFSGFAWSNWNGGDANSYPRHKGEFLWAQVKNVVELDIPNIYVAMFDEYDEGTNVMKMADSYLSIPTDQYFLTSSADGAYISSDFYLRLAGQASKVLRGDAPLTENVSIPFTEGPVYIRTSFEPGYDGLPDWNDTEGKAGSLNMDGLKCGHSNENPYVGSYALKFEGNDNSVTESKATMKVFDVDVPVFSDLKLKFRSYPTNEISRFATIDLILNDGTALSSYNAKDTRGQLMGAANGQGTIDEWCKTICRLGEWLDTTAVSRDTIDKIVVVYDHAPETGAVKTYFEDISIYRLDTDEIQFDNSQFKFSDVPNEIDPGEKVKVSVAFKNTGTSIWSAETGFKLASQNPENNNTWGISSIDFGTDSVYGGEKK
ncbi:MAG TPA: glycoside hydrolase family 71/99-like protein, partial [Bacteroidales bacterium]|nr:glycoside hydrolase family 71/99-like protein [Bacteroidales bacterium]